MRACLIAFLLAGAAGFAPAAVQQTAVRVPSAPATGFRADFLAALDDVEQKIIGLATAVPAEKFTWRPSTGVRSISEVFMHIAGGNYFLASFVDARRPAELPDLEKITTKPEVLAEMKKSFDHLRRAAARESDTTLDLKVTLFGKSASRRYVFMTILNHLHEHLGQSIAYARMNGLTPPWSR